MPKGSGFTVIELIIAVAVVSILTAVAIPQFSNLASRTRLDSTVSDFSHSLALARSKAAYRNSKVAVIPAGATWNSGWTVYEDINSDGKLNQNETVFFQHGPVERSLQISEGTTIAHYISYLPNGYTARKNNAYLMDSLLFCAHGTNILSRKLIINYSGRVRMEDTPAPCPN